MKKVTDIMWFIYPQDLLCFFPPSLLNYCVIKELLGHQPHKSSYGAPAIHIITLGEKTVYHTEVPPEISRTAFHVQGPSVLISAGSAI